MRQGPNNRRSRGRGPRRQHGGGNPRQQTFDSNGPDVRIRGNAYQVLEKYLAMARDATSAGDRIAAENYYQHAEHYYRIINLNGGDHGNNGRFRQGQRPDGQNPGAEGSAVDGASVVGAGGAVGATSATCVDTASARVERPLSLEVTAGMAMAPVTARLAMPAMTEPRNAPLGATVTTACAMGLVAT